MVGWYIGKAKGLRSHLYFHAQDAAKPRTALTCNRSGVFLIFLLSGVTQNGEVTVRQLLSFSYLSLMRAAELNL